MSKTNYLLLGFALYYSHTNNLNLHCKIEYSDILGDTK